jgi:hypothetical protein
MKKDGRVSMSVAAIHCGISVVSFARLLDMGVIERQPREVGYDLTTCRLARFKYLENLAAGRSGADGGALLAKERAILAREQREAAQIKNELARGELVHLEAIKRVFTPMFYNFREIALGTPGVISDAISAHTKEDRVRVFEIVDEKIRDMLDLLATDEAYAQVRPGKQPRSMRRADDIREREPA